MAFVAHTERRPPAEVTCHLATAETRSEARIELLQRMPIFGGIRADVLKYLLGLCSVVSVPTNEFFSTNTIKPIQCSSLRLAKSLC